jgi:hypothetical protein
MMIPQYWAEARIEADAGRSRITIRRYGWSDASIEEARSMAESRAREAYDRIAGGEKLRRIEPKRGYNGAEGVPIREEIVGRYGNAVVTRNSYGALCLNVPDVLFADIDLEDRHAAGAGCMVSFLSGLCAAAVAGIVMGNLRHALFAGLAAAVAVPIAIAVLRRLRVLLSGGLERMARRRIARFLDAHPDWNVRIYCTPAGLRLLAMHRTFDPGDPEASAFFQAIGADPLYVSMCLRQKCFRARLSPKPWRIGIAERIRPEFWPVEAERLAERRKWIAAYEDAARSYAACRYIEEAGSGSINPRARAVQTVHDDLCRAESGLPMA